MQLKLFSGKISKSLQVGQRKRVIRPNRQSIASHSDWNLWTQGADGEKEMALLFLDIRNFTPLVEMHEPQDIIHIVKKLFIAFQNIIHQHHGRIIETTGDGFYAAFGFNQKIKTAVNAAVQSGLSILNSLELLNRGSFEKNLQRRIEVGIGVHAGKVAMGSIRLGEEDHLVVMGYAVNVASRLQASTKELNNNFVVSSAVYQLLDTPPASRPVSDVTLKGVSDGFELHLIGKAYRAEQMEMSCV